MPKPKFPVSQAAEKASETVTHIPMVRDEPAHENGPTTALVHILEVDNYARYGWRPA